MRFVKIAYSSVQEARRRAYVVAVLTHSFISQVFVRMFTKQMLAEGFFTVNVKEVWQLYNIEGVKDYIEPPGCRSVQISRISRQPHNGILLKNPRELTSTGAHFETTVYNMKSEDGSSLFHCSFADDSKSKKYSQYKMRGITPDLHPSVSTAAEGLNVSSAIQQQRSTPLYYNRRASTGGRLNSRVTTTQPSKHEILSSFMQLNAAKVKLQREINKQRIATAQQADREEKKLVVQNMKEINQAIKKEQKKELNKNLNMFYQINFAEKKLRKDILSKQRIQDQLELQSKRERVFEGKRRIDYNRSKQQFCQNFAQQKNIITKQMRIGEMIKKAKINQSQKRLVVERAKAQRLDLAVGVSKFIRMPLQTSLFDTESVMNLSLQQESKHLSQNQSSRLYEQRGSSALPPIQTPYVQLEKPETRIPTHEYSARLKQDRSVFGSTYESYYTTINYPESASAQIVQNIPNPPKGYVGGLRVPALPKLLTNQQAKLQGRKYSENTIKGVFM